VKKLLAIVLAAAIGAAVPVHAETSAQLAENDPRITIYDAGTVSEDYVTVEMPAGDQWVITDQISPGSPIRLLMINGGFVPGAQVVVENSRTLVPVRVISETLYAQVDWDSANRVVTITAPGVLAAFTIDSGTATVNSRDITLDAPAKIIDGRTYVPLRSIAEALGADVGYVENINDFTDESRGKYKVSLVTIEKIIDPLNTQEKHSQEEGLAAVKAASAEMYEKIVERHKDTNTTFSDVDKDYDSQDIAYDNNIGRYYVYRLKEFSGFKILYNSYTGEIYSQHYGLPFLNIDKGFINISWLYQ
jgi:hypothetical protein